MPVYIWQKFIDRFVARSILVFAWLRPAFNSSSHLYVSKSEGFLNWGSIVVLLLATYCRAWACHTMHDGTNGEPYVGGDETVCQERTGPTECEHPTGPLGAKTNIAKCRWTSKCN